MKSLLINLALQMILLAIDGPLKRVLCDAIDLQAMAALPSDVKRKKVAKIVTKTAKSNGKPLSRRLVNLAIEAELVRRRGADV